MTRLATAAFVNGRFVRAGETPPRTVAPQEADNAQEASPATEGAEASGTAPVAALDGMTKDELVAFAAERGIEVSPHDLKAEIRATIDATLEAGA